jgi:hypothetical protein
MYQKLIKHRLTEAFTTEDKAQIKDEVIKALKSSDLKDVISALVSKEVKGNKDLEKQTVEITRNVLTQLFKALWVKKGFWQAMLTNKSS